MKAFIFIFFLGLPLLCGADTGPNAIASAGLWVQMSNTYQVPPTDVTMCQAKKDFESCMTQEKEKLKAALEELVKNVAKEKFCLYKDRFKKEKSMMIEEKNRSEFLKFVDRFCPVTTATEGIKKTIEDLGALIDVNVGHQVNGPPPSRQPERKPVM